MWSSTSFTSAVLAMVSELLKSIARMPATIEKLAKASPPERRVEPLTVKFAPAVLKPNVSSALAPPSLNVPYGVAFGARDFPAQHQRRARYLLLESGVSCSIICEPYGGDQYRRSSTMMLHRRIDESRDDVCGKQ